MATVLHGLLLVGTPRSPIASGESDGARTVTINLGSAAAPSPAPEPRPAEQPTSFTESSVTPRDDDMKPAREKAAAPKARPSLKAERTIRPTQPSNEATTDTGPTARPDKNKTELKKVAQDAEKEGNSSASPIGSDQTAESSARQIESYFGELRQWLAQHRQYPRRARMRRLEGTAVLEIELTADGQVRMSRITRSSGHQRLDDAVREMLVRAQPLPPPPDALDVTGRLVSVPVEFSLR
ncbi:energy transducer TonB [Spiribacter sp. 221]|uniref:energy transducer TonB n=1 Tax=Spiribacter onubensis TaxID=3122420 RepID=UPI00349F0BCB